MRPRRKSSSHLRSLRCPIASLSPPPRRNPPYFSLRLIFAFALPPHPCPSDRHQPLPRRASRSPTPLPTSRHARRSTPSSAFSAASLRPALSSKPQFRILRVASTAPCRRTSPSLSMQVRLPPLECAYCDPTSWCSQRLFMSTGLVGLTPHPQCSQSSRTVRWPRSASRRSVSRTHLLSLFAQFDHLLSLFLQ